MERIVKKQNILKDRKKFVIALIVFASLFAIRDIFSINIHNYIFLGLACFYYLIFDLNECIAFTASLAVWGSGFQSLYAMLFGIFVIFLKKKGKIIFSYEFFILVFILVWEALHVIIPPFSFYEYLRFMVPYIMIWLIIFDKKSGFDYLLVMKTYLFVTAFVLIDIMGQTLLFYNYSISNIIGSGIRFGDIGALTGQDLTLSNNPNFIGMFCGIALAVLIVMIFNTEKKERWKYILGILFFLVFGLFTQSRSFLLMAALAYIIASFHYSIRNRKIFVFNILSVLLILILLYFLLLLLVPNVLKLVMQRLSQDDFSGGRVSIFSRYNSFIINDMKIFFFGVGLQDVLVKVNSMTISSFGNVPHNAMQAAFLSWGILGPFIVLLIFIFVANKASNGKKVKIIYMLPLIVYFAYTQVGHFLGVRYILTILITCFSCIRYGIKDKKDENAKID